MNDSGSIRRTSSDRERTGGISSGQGAPEANGPSVATPAERGARVDSTGVGKPIPRSEARGLEREKPLLRPNPRSTRRNAPYIRQPKPRKTAEAIDDLGEDESYSSSFAHDSNIAVGGATPLSGQAYRRSRADMGKLQRDLHYGQYLEIPKGRRQIFASRERERQIRSRIAAVIVIVVLAIATLLILRLGGALG